MSQTPSASPSTINAIVSAPLPSNVPAILQETSALHIYIPQRYISYGSYTKVNGFHVGVFEAYDPLTDSFSKYICQDHGQYPWGHSTDKGTMAYICAKLGIWLGSNVANTCLPLHVTISLLEAEVLSVKDIIDTHGKFFHTFLSSTFMRDGIPTISSFFRNLKLTFKVCVRLVNSIDAGQFTLLDEYFGNISAKTIYIVHSRVHFFTAKKLALFG